MIKHIKCTQHIVNSQEMSCQLFYLPEEKGTRPEEILHSHPISATVQPYDLAGFILLVKGSSSFSINWGYNA